MKRLGPALFFLALLASCQNDMPSSSLSTVDEAAIVDLNHAIAIAEKADGYVSQQSRLNPADQGANSRMSSSRKVASSFTVKPGQDAASYYIFNYEGGGFAIISGDRRVMPILAFSDQSEFRTDAESYPSAIVAWLEGAHLEVQEARQKNIQQTPLVKAAWDTFEKTYGKQANARTEYEDDGPVPDPRCSYDGELIWNSTYTVGPLLQTTWSQGVGYNDLLSNMSCSGYSNGRPPTGCVATATAQIMRYHSHPNSYSWGSMNNTSGSTATALLMKDIGTAVSMDYDCDGSSAQTSDAASALTGTFGYSTASYGNYDYNTVRSEVKNFNRPVILRGGRNSGWWIFGVYADGHAWVCDGTRETEYWRCYQDGGNLYSTPYIGYLYLHMNWGWGGSYNGFYAFNNFNPGSHTFNYKTRQIVNIKP